MTPLLEAFGRVRASRGVAPLICLPGTGEHLSADALWHGATSLAAEFREARVPAGAGVALTSGNHPATFIAWLAARLADVTLVPVDRSAAREELDSLVSELGLYAVVGRAGDPLPDSRDTGQCRLQVLARQVRDQVRLYPGAAALKLTSGTSGRFKAAFTTESQLMADGAQIAAAFGTGPDDMQVVAIPLSHAYGLGTILLPLLMQGTRVVLRDTFVPQQVVGDAVTFSAGIFCGVPFMFDHFLAHQSAEPWPPTLTRLRAAGARLDPSTQSRFRRTFGVSVHSFYGASETGGICFDASDEPPSETVVGRPLPGVQVTLLPFEGAQPGVGQVHIVSPAVSDGYIGEPGGFVNGGFLSGDLGRFDREGRLVLTGRVSSFVNVAGRKVQPEEVEKVLRGMAGVREAAVLGVEDSVRGELLVACLVGDASTGLIDVRRYCLARLAPHKVPRVVVWLDALPVTARGKADRRRLREIAASRVADHRLRDM